MGEILWAFFIILATPFAPPIEPAALQAACEAQGGKFVAQTYMLHQQAAPESDKLIPVNGIIVYCGRPFSPDDEQPKQIEPKGAPKVRA